MPFAYLCTASATCIASSRVGTSTSPHVVRGASLRLGDPLEHRQRERRRLAGAGFGLAEQISGLKQQRNRFALNRRRLFIAEGGDDVGEFGPKAERGKRDSIRGSRHLDDVTGAGRFRTAGP